MQIYEKYQTWQKDKRKKPLYQGGTHRFNNHNEEKTTPYIMNEKIQLDNFMLLVFHINTAFETTNDHNTDP